MRTAAMVVDISLPSALSANLRVAGQWPAPPPARVRAAAPAAGRRARRAARADMPSRRYLRAACRIRSRRDLLVRQRQLEAVAEGLERLDVQLLGLVRGHARFARTAHAIALLGLGQNHGRPAAVIARRGERGVQLAQIVAAALQALDLAVRHVRDQRLDSGSFFEEVLDVVGAVLGAEVLILAVDGLARTAAAAHAACRARTARPTPIPRAP